MKEKDNMKKNLMNGLKTTNNMGNFINKIEREEFIRILNVEQERSKQIQESRRKMLRELKIREQEISNESCNRNMPLDFLHFMFVDLPSIIFEDIKDFFK